MQSGKRPNSSPKSSGAAAAYRGRVHSLLGLPNEGYVGPEAPAATMPVDFHYRQGAAPSGGSEGQDGFSPAASYAMPTGPAEVHGDKPPAQTNTDQVIRQPVPRPAIRQGALPASEQKEPAYLAEAAKPEPESHVEQLPATLLKQPGGQSGSEDFPRTSSPQMPAVKPKSGAGEALAVDKQEATKQVDSGPEQIEIEIPGSSPRRLSFAAVSAASAAAEKVIGAVEEPIDKAEQSAFPNLARPQGAKPEVEKANLGDVPGLPQRILAAQLGKEQAEAISQTMRIRPQARLEKQPPVERMPVEGSGSVERSLPAPRQSGPLPEGEQPGLPQVDLAGLARSQRETADTLDQLQQAMQQLTAKTASAAASPALGSRQAEPERPQPLPPPVQHIVVLNRSVGRSSTPRAFWERSYLSRSRFIVRR